MSSLRFGVLGAVAFIATSIGLSGIAQAITLTAETALTSVQQTANSPCLFSTTNCSQPGGFPALTDLPGSGAFADFTDNNYGVGALRSLLGGNFFDIGIDVSWNNDDGHVLNRFYVEKVGGGIVGDYNPAVPTALAPAFNAGSGFSDSRLSIFSLAGLADTDFVRFYLSLSEINDGPDQFFLIGRSDFVPPDPVADVPLPGAVWLMATAIAGGAAGMRIMRRRRTKFAA